MEQELEKYLEGIDELDHDCVKAICEAVEERYLEPNFKEVVRIYEEGYYIFYPDMDLEDVALEIIRNTINFPRNWEKYLDLPQMARDLEDDRYIETSYGTVCLE